MEPLNCDGCRACCIGDAQRPMPHEVGMYHTEIYNGVAILKHKPNGECFYLGPDGCTIHSWKPQKCQELDCRMVLLHVGEKQMRKFCQPEMVEAAKKRLRETST